MLLRREMWEFLCVKEQNLHPLLEACPARAWMKHEIKNTHHSSGLVFNVKDSNHLDPDEYHDESSGHSSGSMSLILFTLTPKPDE